MKSLFQIKPLLLQDPLEKQGVGENTFYLPFSFWFLFFSSIIHNSFKCTLSEKSPLAQFCVDLTARASEGLLDPVIGRENEVQRVIQILCRRTKNNPILLGQSGVGKTAIVEGLATRIAEEDVPGFLMVSV